MIIKCSKKVPYPEKFRQNLSIVSFKEKIKKAGKLSVWKEFEVIAKLKFEVNRKCSRPRELSSDSVVNDYVVIPETHEIRRGNKIC